MPVRAFYHNQILANCSVLFPGTEPKLITANDFGTRRIFVISSNGELLLEHEGTNANHFSGLLTRTEAMLTAHVADIRAGTHFAKEEKGNIARENERLSERIMQLECEKMRETARSKAKEQLEMFRDAQHEEMKEELEMLRRRAEAVTPSGSVSTWDGDERFS